MVYSYKPPADVDITIATCGSGFDTKLLVSTNLSDPSTYTCNDDDRTCTTNTACSRLDISLKVGRSIISGWRLPRVSAAFAHEAASSEQPEGTPDKWSGSAD